jgi:hypothetical protein
MNIQKIENRLLYVPNKNSGTSTFNGEAHYSQKVLDIIGEEGVKHISNKLEQCLDMKKELFGNGNKEFYGLSASQKFFDLKERITFDIKAIIEPHNSDELHKIDFQDNYRIEVNEDKEESCNLLCSKRFRKSNISAYKTIKSGILE